MKPKGSIYVLTLATALVLVIITVGLSRLLIRARQDARAARQIEQAQIHAQLGLRHALWATHRNDNWRTILPNGEWLTDIAVGQAVYSVTGTDPDDGDLADNPSDPVILQCSATVGDAARALQVEARSTKMDFLDYRAVAGNLLKIENHAVIQGDIFSNNNITKTGGDTWIYGDVSAVGAIADQTNISGVITEGADPLGLPTGQSVYDFYAPLATVIPYQNEIFAKVLSPTSNPYGAANADGVYLMNCSGNKVVIKQCRIIGTLVLVNPTNDSAVEISVNWRPARTDYPALIIRGGEFEIKIDRAVSEAEINTDLSMPGEPGYGTKTDTYNGEIHGMIFTTHRLKLSQQTKLYGMAVSLDELNLRDSSRIEPDPLDPDPAIQPFVKPALIPVRGSYQWITP